MDDNAPSGGYLFDNQSGNTLAPGSFSVAAGSPGSYSYKPNGSGGLNYFAGGNAITNTQYGQATGQDYGALEQSAYDTYNQSKAAAPDANAAAQAKADAANKAAFAAQKQGILDTTGQASANAGNSYKSSILDFLDTLKSGQHTIDEKATQAELSKRQGAAGVRDYISNGIQSGGVMLGNKNASNSSAVDALARAYSALGGRQMQGVGQQYAEDEHAISEDQNTLNSSVATQSRHNEEQKANSVNSILSDATGKLSALDAAIAAASLPDRIDLNAQKESIRQQALAQLQQYDSLYSGGVAGIQPTSLADRQGSAAQLLSSGVAATSPYQLTTEAPAAFSEGQAAAGGGLPIFTLPRNRQQNA